jgi:hypothetical protein
MQLQTKTSNQLVSLFLELFTKGVEAWTQAGEVLVVLVEKDPAGYELIASAGGGIVNRKTLSLFERIGRRQLLPSLAYSSSVGQQRLARLPLSMQEKYTREPVELLLLKDDGTTDKLLVEVENLTPAQASQVFNHDGVRSLEAQRAWLEAERTAAIERAKTVRNMPYKIIGRRVKFYECTLDAKEIVRILGEIEK